MNHEGSSAVVDNDGERPDFRYIAWLLQEKLNALLDGDQGEPPELELQSLLNQIASRKIISVDPKMLNPVLWRTLPKELLLLVLTHLPVPDITRLRFLSKEWNRDMTTMNSEINRALDETSPIMIAVFSRSYYYVKHRGHGMYKPTYHVSICSQRPQYSYYFHPGNPGNDRWHDMNAHDGGLVCFASTWKPSKANPMCIVVVNLLTQVRWKLPPLQYVYLAPPTMMHIEVDSETKYYRVVVVGNNINGRPTIEIYDSGARQWTKATPPLGFIFGFAYHWEYDICNGSFESTCQTQSVYDFAEGQLKNSDLKYSALVDLPSTITYACHKDCIFVLHRNTSNGEILAAGGHCITKYRMQNNAKDWVQERSYLCSPLLEKEYCSMALKACEGFLMVFSWHSCSSSSCEHSWVLDLSTGEWSSLPNYFFESHIFFGGSMSRASWNVVP